MSTADQIRKLIRAGLSTKEIAIRLDTRPEYVRHQRSLMRRNLVKVRKRKLPIEGPRHWYG